MWTAYLKVCSRSLRAKSQGQPGRGLEGAGASKRRGRVRFRAVSAGEVG